MLVGHKTLDDRGHSSKHYILSEIIEHDLLLDFGERIYRDHVIKQILYLIFLISFGPEIFFKIQ